MIILTLTTITFLTISVILTIRGFALLTKIEELEDKMSEYQLRDKLTKEVLESMLNQMKEVDLKGSFESDDEVGTVFTQLKTIIEIYNNIEQDA
jgi:hypothetical protein